MIDVQHLTKRYRTTLAVDDLTFTVTPGKVTGFLGPNGAGKSTTMRMMLGLDLPTSGSARINGKPLAAHPRPLHEVGALLEARAVHTGRSARNHLRALAATESIPRRRVNHVIELAGLADIADRRVGGFSLGMGQRLGIAAALRLELTIAVTEARHPIPRAKATGSALLARVASPASSVAANEQQVHIDGQSSSRDGCARHEVRDLARKFCRLFAD